MNLTEIYNQFEYKGSQFTVVRIKSPRISLPDTLTQFELELKEYELEIPDSDLCIDFKSIETFVTKGLISLLNINKTHQHIRKRALALSCVKRDPYELFNRTKTNRVFRIFRDIHHYKKDPLNPNPENHPQMNFTI